MKAMTVLGPVDGSALGTTLIHEHLVFDFRDYWSPPPEATQIAIAEHPIDQTILGKLRTNPFLFKKNLVHGNIDLTVAELRSFQAAGGRTLVDPTNASIGRDPAALQQIARLTGLNILMGAGYYTEISLNDAFKHRSSDDIADEITRDVLEGVGPHHVRAGIIGEIGTSSPITDAELTSLRASARAQARTNAPLMVHLDGWQREGDYVLDIIEEEGGDVTHTILCHMNPSWHDREYQTRLARRGAYIEYDMMGMVYSYPPAKASPDDGSTLAAIAQLIQDGHLNNILMSQDVFLKSMFKHYGGMGYDHVFANLDALYEANGITAEHLHTIFVDNPARALSYLAG